MQMDSRLILGGQAPNVMSNFAGGAQTGQFMNDSRQQNALRAMLQEQGPGIRQGNPESLNALARFDPQAALGVENTRGQMQDRQERLGLAREASRREGQKLAMAMSAAKRQEEAAKLEKALAMGTQAQTPEQWDAMMTGLDADEYVGQFHNRDVIIAGAVGLKEALEMAQGPEPQSPEGKFEADRRAGLVPEGATRGKDSATEEKIDLLMETGISREAAINALVRYDISRDPVSGTAQLVDRVTGETVALNRTEQAQAQGGAQQQPQPQGAQVQGGAEESPVPRAQPDFSGATGVPGVVANLGNVVASMAGQSLPAPEANEAFNQVNSLIERTAVTLATDAQTGRAALQTIEGFKSTLPRAGAMTEGPEISLSKARNTIDQLRNQINDTRRIADNPSEFSGEAVSNARAKLVGLETMLSEWSRIESGLASEISGSGQQRQAEPQGEPAVTIDQVRAMSPQERNAVIRDIGIGNLPDDVLDFLIEQGGQ